MSHKIDLTGKTFGRLTVISCAGTKYYGKDKQPCLMWNVKCECGTVKIVRGSDLKSGHTTSCGCYNREICSEEITRRNKNMPVRPWMKKHGDKGTRLYRIWVGMKQRCMNPNNKDYENYGGRGVMIDEEWIRDYKNFKQWAISNGYADDLEIDRKDVNGGYSPENCRWVTQKENANNKRRNIYLTFNGETKTLAQWAESLNIPYERLHSRYRKGKTAEEILNVKK